MSEEKEELVTGVVPGNVADLSERMESDKHLEEEIIYLSGGVESYRNLNQKTRFPLSVSTEEAKFDLGAIIERILRFLNNMVKDVLDGSTAAAMGIENIIDRAEEVLLDGRSQRRNHQLHEFIIDTRVQNLCVKYKPISDPQFLLIQLKTLSSVVSAVYAYLNHSVYGCFEEVIKFDPFADDIEELALKMLPCSPASMAGNPKFANQGMAIYSPQLLGNQQIVIDNKRPDSSPLDQILACCMSIQPAEREPRAAPPEIKYTKFGLSLEQSLVREVIGIATKLSDVNTINRRTVRRNRLTLITERLNYLNKRITDITLDEPSIVHVRNYIRVLEVYSGWIASPYVGLIALTHRNLTAILNVCEGNAK